MPDGLLYTIVKSYESRNNDSRKSHCPLVVLSRDRINSVTTISRLDREGGPCSNGSSILEGLKAGRISVCTFVKDVAYGARTNESLKKNCTIIVLSREGKNSVVRFFRIVYISDNRTKVQFLVQFLMEFGGISVYGTRNLQKTCSSETRTRSDRSDRSNRSFFNYRII